MMIFRHKASNAPKVIFVLLFALVALAVYPVRPTYAADTGWQSPTNCTSSTWGTPGNATTSDNAYATSAGNTQQLVCTFNIPAIPAGNRINLIEVGIEGFSSGTREAAVDLSWNGGANFTTTDPTTTFDAAETTFILTGTSTGAPQQQWGRTWSVGEFTAANFQLRLTSDTGNGTISLDQVQVRVTYDLPPEINILGFGVSIVDGDTTPSVADGTDFGDVGQGTIVDRTFTITNTGTGPLILANAAVTGSTSFTLLTAPTSPVPAGGSTTFVIRFQPDAFGGAAKLATFSVDNNDSNERTYNFDVAGNSITTGSEIDVQGNGITIVDGDATPSNTDGTNFGNVYVGSNATKTFTILNNGSQDLTIGAFTFTGDFSLSTPPTTPVVAGASTTFQVRFTPAATGVRNGSISFVNNDGTENPYDFNLAGTGVANTPPTITSNGGGVTATISVAENTTAVTTVTATDPNIPPQTLTYSISGTDASDFSIIPSTGVLTFSPAPNFEVPVDADTNNSYLIDVQVSDGVGTDAQTITVNVTDVNEAPTDIALSATSIAENNAVNDVIGALTTTDPDVGNTFTYSLSCATPGIDDTSFNISGANLQSGAVFDFETQNSYAICMRTIDQGGLFFDKNFTITITNVDELAPTVAVNQAGAQADPTNATPISFDVVFSEAINPATFTAVDITQNGTATGITWNVTNSGDNINFTLIATSIATNGTVVPTIGIGAFSDFAGNYNTAASTSTDNSVTYDTSALIVTIDQAGTQADPTNATTINFTVVFSAATTNFATGDVTLGGTAGATTATVTGSGTTYNVAVTGMTSNGTVIATIAAGVATDAATNPNAASTSIDNTVTFDSVNPTVASTDLVASYTGVGPGSFIATFSKAVDDPAGNTGTDDVTNTANYVLINKGTNGIANTVSCAGGVVADDTKVTVTSASYNNVTFRATVTLVSPLPVGSYRLFVCGTTSIVDLAGNPLNGGTDYTFDFTVQAAPPITQAASAATLPATGFAPGEFTKLPVQLEKQAYASLGNLWLEIPSQAVKISIVGVPLADGTWDVSWLWNQAGYLEGTAFPTWAGNSVITGHVYLSNGKPGPFIGIRQLRWGDKIIVHAFGQIYTYEVRAVDSVRPTAVKSVMAHEDKSWITLLTCQEYDEKTNTYRYRTVVKAVLVEVK